MSTFKTKFGGGRDGNEMKKGRTLQLYFKQVWVLASNVTVVGPGEEGMGMES